jgi:hypothetical protein
MVNPFLLRTDGANPARQVEGNIGRFLKKPKKRLGSKGGIKLAEIGLLRIGKLPFYVIFARAAAQFYCARRYLKVEKWTCNNLKCWYEREKGLPWNSN